MTTTENTPTERADMPAMGFKNPTDWAIGAVAGVVVAAVLVGGLTFIPTWVVYTVVGAVSLWLVLKLGDAAVSRRSRDGQQEDERARDTAGVPE